MDEAHGRVLLCELFKREIGHCGSGDGDASEGVIGPEFEVVRVEGAFVPGGEDGDDAWGGACGEEREKVHC